MNKAKTKTRTTRTVNKKRVARESSIAYTTRAPESKQLQQSKWGKEPVREIRDGKPYEYYPLGRFIIVAPQIAGVKPIFKYTRVRVKRALGMIADGASIDEVADKLNSAHIPPDAVKEALELARKAFVKAHPPLRRVKRWV